MISRHDAYVNLEAEMSALGCALQSEKCVKLVVDMPSEEFNDTRHRLVHEAICELHSKGTAVDLITLDAQLSRGDRLALAGGTEYLISMMQITPTTVNIKHYIQLVHQCALRRRMRHIGTQLIENAGSLDMDADEIREWAAMAIRDVSVGSCDPIISMKEACMNTYEKIERMQRDEGKPETKGIMTGISSLDAKLGGLNGSKLVVIGARPSVGKSILALTICVNAAKQGKRILLISLEMDDTEITERVFANEACIPMSNLTTGKMSDENWVDLANNVGRVSTLPLWYCMEASTVERIRRVAFSLYENGGLDMIAVDYIQLMEATYAKKQNRQEQVAEISRGLKKLSQEMKIPIVALTQLNRQSEGSFKGVKTKRQPTMSEARESGAIEQDANIFILLHDPDIEEMRSESERETWKNLKDAGLTMFRVIIDKNRQGKRGVLTVAFDGDHMRFLPIMKQQNAEPPPPKQTQLEMYARED